MFQMMQLVRVGEEEAPLYIPPPTPDEAVFMVNVQLLSFGEEEAKALGSELESLSKHVAEFLSELREPGHKSKAEKKEPKEAPKAEKKEGKKPAKA